MALSLRMLIVIVLAATGCAGRVMDAGLFSGRFFYKPDPFGPQLEMLNCEVDPSNPENLETLKKCPFREFFVPEFRPPDISPKPDLVIAVHAATATSSSITHRVVVRNVGAATAVIGEPLTVSNQRAHIQFYVSKGPMLEGKKSKDWDAAGGWSLAPRSLDPGKDIELSLTSG